MDYQDPGIPHAKVYRAENIQVMLGMYIQIRIGWKGYSWRGIDGF